MAGFSRIRVLSLFVLLSAALIVSRLFYVQVLNSEKYREQADRQYAVPSAHTFDRGSMFFKERSGKLISAAALQNGYLLTINPKELKDAETAYQAISAVIPIEHDNFMLRAGKTEDPYEEIAHRVGKDEAEKISKLKLPGVSLYTEKWRFYPAKTLAAQTIGFMAYKGDELSGRYGLERFYNSTLERQRGDLYVNFFAEVFTNLKSSILGDEGKEGDLVLTIDPAIQTALESELANLNEKYNSEFSGGIIMDPRNGGIYALAKFPTFDLNKFNQTEDVSVFNNNLVEGAYEMGSIIKPLTMAAALDQKVLTATTTYNDTGTLTLNNRTIYNFDKKGRGITTMQEVLNESLNTGAVFAMQRLGKERFRDYMLAYGLGEKTGIDLPAEGRNLISNLETNRDIEFANASFGQGIALTPIATTRALAVLGNGGYLVTPHLVEKINYKSGLSESKEFTNGKQVLRPETSEEITRMLVRVVDKALLGGTVKMEHYSIAAKTGTAQLEKEDNSGYYDDRFLHSFFGYFPAYDPSFIIFLFTRDPKGEKYASQTLTRPFMDLTKFLINYYEIPPDR